MNWSYIWNTFWPKCAPASSFEIINDSVERSHLEKRLSAELISTIIYQEMKPTLSACNSNRFSTLATVHIHICILRDIIWSQYISTFLTASWPLADFWVTHEKESCNFQNLQLVFYFMKPRKIWYHLDNVYLLSWVGLIVFVPTFKSNCTIKLQTVSCLS